MSHVTHMNAGGTGGNKLKSMLSADNTEVREVEKFKSGKVCVCAYG